MDFIGEKWRGKKMYETLGGCRKEIIKGWQRIGIGVVAGVANET